jgi:hypothetical protein
VTTWESLLLYVLLLCFVRPPLSLTIACHIQTLFRGNASFYDASINGKAELMRFVQSIQLAEN